MERRGPSYRDRFIGLGKGVAFNVLRERIKNDVCINYEILGRENIDSARELLTQGKIIVGALDHRSFADMTTGACIAIKEDFDDLVQVAHIVMKISYLQTFPTNLLPKYFRVIPVVPHTTADYPNRNEINNAAIAKAQNLADGSLLVVSPEGTRSGQASMQEARFGSERFWHGRGERYLISIAIEKTERQWPKKLGLVAGGIYYYHFGRFIKARYIFGKPTSVDNFDLAAQRLANNEEELTRLKSEIVMADIARLHLEKGNEEYAGRYAKLARELHI